MSEMEKFSFIADMLCKRSPVLHFQIDTGVLQHYTFTEGRRECPVTLQTITQYTMRIML